MGDFFQNGPITTLQNLSRRPAEELEAELVGWSAQTPMALVIPSLFSELKRPALTRIVDELSQIPYLSQIIIGLDGADADEYKEAKRFFSRLPQPHRVLWNHGPRMQDFDAVLREHAVAPMEEGKGRNVWFCLGYFLAAGQCEAVALHDADITTYERSMVARLFYPVVHPTFGYAFSKGYYFRSDGSKLNGRVSRLFVSPLVRAMGEVVGKNEYLDYLDSFRYPLAGEFAMHVNVVRGIRIPSDWGLEIGVLSEVHRRYTNQRICQVDIADAYDHKHQELSPDDPEEGLHRMAGDIAKAMYRKLAISGTVFSPEIFRTIKAVYYRSALDMVERYANVATINGLDHDEHAEELMVEVFSQVIMTAGDAFLSNPMDTPFMSSWSRVQSAVPDAFARLIEAVDADNTDS